MILNLKNGLSAVLKYHNEKERETITATLESPIEGVTLDGEITVSFICNGNFKLKTAETLSQYRKGAKFAAGADIVELMLEIQEKAEGFLRSIAGEEFVLQNRLIHYRHEEKRAQIGMIDLFTKMREQKSRLKYFTSAFKKTQATMRRINK